MKPLATGKRLQKITFLYTWRLLPVYFTHRLLTILVFTFFYFAASAQNAVVKDSISRDSVNNVFLNQVKQNDAALGIDTTRFLPDSALNTAGDTTITDS